MTAQQRDFLCSLNSLGCSPTDADLLSHLSKLIEAAPPWLRALEQLIGAERQKVVVVAAEELLQWTDERLNEVIRSGKTLSFEDPDCGVKFAITWGEQAQTCYDRARRVRSASIAGLLINWLAQQIEIIEY